MRSGALEAKIRIEQDDPAGRYLLYSPAEEPDFDDDWLLDIRLYSRSFRADRASIILDELGLAHQSCASTYRGGASSSTTRSDCTSSSSWSSPPTTNWTLIGRCWQSSPRPTSPSCSTSFAPVSLDGADGRSVDLDEPPPAWEQIEKFELDEPFWEHGQAAFGYSGGKPDPAESADSLAGLRLRSASGSELPDSLQNLLLPGSGTANAVVCLAQWRDSSSKAAATTCCPRKWQLASTSITYLAASRSRIYSM